jgi:ATP-binding cassette subfamily C (CFTR/MRP) protein 10
MLELLRGIRQIKSYVWERLFAGKVQEERSAELAALAVRKYLDALCVYFWYVSGAQRAQIWGSFAFLDCLALQASSSLLRQPGCCRPACCRAATSLLFSLTTFGLFALMGRQLTPQVLLIATVPAPAIGGFCWVLMHAALNQNTC